MLVHPKSTAALVKKLNADNDSNSHIVPKRIFLFWNKLPMPKFVQYCFDLWQQKNPDYEIYLFDEQKIHAALKGDFPTSLNNLGVAQRSDWYRLSLLEKYGGVYIDATTICLSSLSSWVDHDLNALQGFSVPATDFSYRIMESWAIACPKESEFMAQWRDEFRYALSIGLDSYKLVCEKRGHPLMTYLLPDQLPYLSIHAAWINVSAKNPNTSCLLRRSDAVHGPFGWLAEAQWDLEEAVQNLLSKPASHYAAPFLKIRCCDRLRLDAYILRRQYRNDSIFCEVLGLPRSRPR